MTQEEFETHPLVQRLRTIFGNPKPPEVITEWMWSDYYESQDVFPSEVANLPWYAMDSYGINLYKRDLLYVDLQPELFNYMFPATLSWWWRCLRSYTDENEVWSRHIYFCLHYKSILQKMLLPHLQDQLFLWIADAYIDGVRAWESRIGLLPDYLDDRFSGPLYTFEGLMATVPNAGILVEQLLNVDSVGKALWWTALADHLSFNPEDPFAPRRYRSEYRLEILPSNKIELQQRVDSNTFLNALVDSELILQPGYDYDRLKDLQKLFWANRHIIDQKFYHWTNTLSVEEH